MPIFILVFIVCIACMAPFAFQGMSNSYAGIMQEIRGLLKKRFKLRQRQGRFLSMEYMDYEDRILKCIPYISDKDITGKYINLAARRRTKRLFS